MKKMFGSVNQLMQGRPLFPPCVDSTMLASFRSCPYKMETTYVRHWKPIAESVHLVAGKAFAEGIEKARRAFFEQSASREDSEAIGLTALFQSYGDFECPPDSAKSVERTAGALEFYFANYPLGEDGTEPITTPNGRRGIEFSFAEPLAVKHPTLDQPILYTGRADMIAHFSGGVYVFDEKTASQLGPSWSRQWELRSQFTGYNWAARKAGIHTDGVIVRGISILKTKYDTQQALTYRPEWEIDRWLEQTERDVRRMIRCWEEGYWDYNLDHSCAEYGGCSLAQVCKSNDPQAWLEGYFEQRVWNPLERAEQTVEEWENSWK